MKYFLSALIALALITGCNNSSDKTGADKDTTKMDNTVTLPKGRTSDTLLTNPTDTSKKADTSMKKNP